MSPPLFWPDRRWLWLWLWVFSPSAAVCWVGFVVMSGCTAGAPMGWQNVMQWGGGRTGGDEYSNIGGIIWANKTENALLSLTKVKRSWTQILNNSNHSMAKQFLTFNLLKIFFSKHITDILSYLILLIISFQFSRNSDNIKLRKIVILQFIPNFALNFVLLLWDSPPSRRVWAQVFHSLVSRKLSNKQFSPALLETVQSGADLFRRMCPLLCTPLKSLIRHRLYGARGGGNGGTAKAQVRAK